MYRYALKFHKKMKYKDFENFSNCTDNIIPKYKQFTSFENKIDHTGSNLFND